SASSIAMSSTSAHLRLMTTLASVTFGNLIDRVFRYFNDQVYFGNDRLTGEPRVGLQAPGLVQHVVFELIRLLQRSEAFSHNHVTGGAGTGFRASMFDVDAVTQRHIQHGFTGLRFNYGAFWTMLGIGQENNLRHLCHSSISLSRRPANAALTVESSLRAA